MLTEMKILEDMAVAILSQMTLKAVITVLHTMIIIEAMVANGREEMHLIIRIEEVRVG